MPIFSKDDSNLWEVATKGTNKIASTLFLIWIKKYFGVDGFDPRILETIADIILLTDSKDIGSFDHVHHWITGYIMKTLSQARQLPEDQRTEKILDDLSKLNDPKKTRKFINKRGYKL